MKNHLPAVVAGVGATIAIFLLAIVDSLQSEFVLLMAPFGASAVLVFGIPNSPLAQPKNVILGHLLTAFIGVVFVILFPVEPWSLALATGLAVSAMLMTKTTHPPAGANPLLIMMAGQGWEFLIFPVFIGAIAIVIVGQLMKKVVPKAE